MKISLVSFIFFITLLGCKSESRTERDLSKASRTTIIPKSETKTPTNPAPQGEMGSGSGTVGDQENTLFCAKKKPFNYLNALWLTQIAALQYSHYKVAGPEIEKLGFGDPGDGEIYFKYWYIHRLKMIQEKTKSNDDSWEDEAGRLAQWEILSQDYKTRFKEPYVDDGSKAKDFQDSFLKTTNNKKIQFLSGISDSKIFQSSSSQVMYAENSKENYSVIAFRGTEVDRITDILDDLTVTYATLPGMGKVHSGFADALDDVEPQLLKILKDRSSEAPLNIWITGHSLGGSIATLFTAKLMLMLDKGELKNVNLMGTYTVGQPRVGNNTFAKLFDTMAQKQAITVVRFRNHADPVTTVPIGLSGIGGYWHVGSLAYIGGDGVIYFRGGWTDIETKSDLRKTFTLNPSDHRVVNYYKAITKASLANQGTDLMDCSLPEQNIPPTPFYEDKSLRTAPVGP